MSASISPRVTHVVQIVSHHFLGSRLTLKPSTHRKQSVTSNAHAPRGHWFSISYFLLPMDYYDLSFLVFLPLNVFFLVFGLVVIGFGLFAYTLKKRLFLVDLLVATCTGIVLGPRVTGLIDPLSWPSAFLILEEITLIVLALQVVSNSFALYSGYLWRNKLDVFILLGPVLLCSWVTASLLIWGILDLPLSVSFVIGAAITPTDPGMLLSRLPCCLLFALSRSLGSLSLSHSHTLLSD